jgi:hypothetical protein
MSKLRKVWTTASLISVAAAFILSLFILPTVEIETRFLIFGALLLLFLGVAYMVGKFGSDRKMPRGFEYLYFGFVFVMLSVSWMQYATLRPAAPFSIVVMTETMFVVSAVIGIIALVPVRGWAVFGKFGWKERLFRLALVLYGYVILFAVLSQAIAYALNAVVQPSSVSSNPEVALYIVPAITATILIFYRLQAQVEILSFDIPRRIAEDAIFASFVLFVYISILTSAGVMVSNPIGSLASTFPAGLLSGAIGLAVEWYFLKLDSLFGKTLVMFKSKLLSLPEFLFIIFQKRSSAKYATTRPARSTSFALPRRLTFLQNKTSKRILTATLFLSVILLGWLVYFSPRQTTAILVPVWRIDVEVTRVVPVSTILSDQMDRMKAQNVSIPLVVVRTANSSFVAPLNSRYLRVNSSDFQVMETGEFLTISLLLRPVEIRVSEPFYAHPQYDQTGNSMYAYLGLYRDAEIFYALHSSAYDRIFSICEQTVSGTITKNVKQIYAESPNRRLLITISIEGETIPLDYTTVESLDSVTASEISNLVQQARVGSPVETNLQQPPIPFWMSNATLSGQFYQPLVST